MAIAINMFRREAALQESGYIGTSPGKSLPHEPGRVRGQHDGARIQFATAMWGEEHREDTVIQISWASLKPGDPVWIAHTFDEVIAPGSSDLDGIRAAIFLKDGGVSLSDSASVQTGRGPGSRGVHCPGNGRGHGDDVGKGSMYGAISFAAACVVVEQCETSRRVIDFHRYGANMIHAHVRSSH